MTEPALPLLASSTGAYLHLLATQCQQDLALLEVLYLMAPTDAESLEASTADVNALAARIREVAPVQPLDPEGAHRATLSLCVEKARLLHQTAQHRAKSASNATFQMQLAQAVNLLAPACEQLMDAVAAHDLTLQQLNVAPIGASAGASEPAK